ncbi:thioredoxin domain-containing protein [Pseudomonas qingdaonensis]|nr:thioredoxin domain-containing protein [Pseudomonas qingdaonensis]
MATLKVPVSADDHRQGSAHAKVTLVEFGDYECPYCGEAYWMVKNLQQHFRDDLLFVFRNFPLTTAHPHALGAAVTAEYAGSRGFFWEAHDGLYENQDRLGLPLYRAIVLKHGLSRGGIRSCNARGYLHSQNTSRFQWRCTQRREWHPSVLH